ncbi:MULTISPECIES: hypothetical protein [unclassified Neptuniibacter]|uniref:hypothetical protein n=1 Tax=unclassified Neptuniibacter TaxID=2630693 RepID=UPI000C56FB17|nr:MULTISPECIES: hypothetical protein [unclassified Neptuniibacter]MAY43350.1 hypothetical protein [Oceanospirillaceae bacterium]|tara:strand:+ start:13023 stop:13538 length:516 start_codon:yes stop_codon:yes gene_type:complete
MSEELLGLTLAYVFFTALVLLAVIYGRLAWPLKAGLIVIAVVFYWFSYNGWKETQGWPSQVELPQKFLLHYAVIEEPNEETGEKGKIYIWLTDLLNDELAEKPRAYELPYDQAAHSAVEEALKKTRNGQPQLGQPAPRKAKPSDPKQKNALGQKMKELKFSNVPAPALPEK